MNWNPTIHKFERYCYLILAIGLVAYIALRAYLVPFIFDEAVTFYIYIQNGEYLPFVGFIDANNHLLNSFLGYISYSIFGFSKLAIRLPNVLSAVLYVWGIWRLVSRLNSIWLRWATISSLFAISFLIEFFSMARGYGLSMGLFVLGISFVGKQFTYRNLYVSIGLLSLATLANLTLISLLLLVLFWWFVFLIQRPFKSIIKGWLGFTILGVIPALFCVAYSFVLKNEGALYLGGDKGLVGETLTSLNLEIFHENDLIYSYVLIGVYAVLFIAAAVSMIKNGVLEYFKNANNAFVYYLFGSICFIVLQNVLLDVNYPQERSVLYLIPLSVLSIVFSINKLPQKIKQPVSIGSLLLALVFPLDFISVSNISYVNYTYWITEYIPKEVTDIYDSYSDDLGRPPTLSGYYTKSCGWANLAFNDHVSRSPMLKLDYPNPNADLVWVKDEIDSLKLLNTHKRVLHDSISTLSLYKREHPVVEKLLFDKNVSFSQIQDSEFSNFLDYKVDSTTIGSNLRLEINLDLTADQLPFNPIVVFNDQDTIGGYNYYTKYHTDWFLDFNQNPTQKAYVSLFIGPIDKSTNKVIAYIWNLNRSEGRVNGSVKLYQY